MEKKKNIFPLLKSTEEELNHDWSSVKKETEVLIKPRNSNTGMSAEGFVKTIMQH